jgi:DNA-binding transcriptional MerR regulator
MRIGELAEAAGTTSKALRFYEERGLIPRPERTSTGYRDYTPEAVTRIHFIRRGQAAGLTLAQIRPILNLRDRGDSPCAHVRVLLETHLADIEDQIQQLTTLRDSIIQLRSQADPVDPDQCNAEQVCRYL